LPVHRIEQIAVSSVKRKCSEREILLLAIRTGSVLDRLKHRAADTVRQYAISQGGARIRIDRPRADRFDSIGLMLEGSYLVIAYA
jgi:hypothetical protein